LNGLIRFLFFGNYFYGFCAIGLSIEASLQQHSRLNSVAYYVFVFTATVLYYTHAYIAEPAPPQGNSENKRSLWYFQHQQWIRGSQLLLTILFISLALFLLKENSTAILSLPAMYWGIILVFPLVAALYYGSTAPSTAAHSLRNRGWLKPFVIGFVWAGMVTVYPVLFSTIENGTVWQPDITSFLLFIKNFMYITMLCIMFDIKDYAADHNKQLKTFVVRYGLRKTIFYILIPLTAVGLGTFLIFATMRGFPFLRILINTIPFLLLITVAYSMYRRKSILYYLAIIDGLMLAKALCGIAGMLLIN
jgi:4-hydroxybenzoate polyprenyltransferase